MEIMLKNKFCLYVIISIQFFSIKICNLIIEFPSYLVRMDAIGRQCRAFYWKNMILSVLYLSLSTIRIIPYALQNMYVWF